MCPSYVSSWLQRLDVVTGMEPVTLIHHMILRTNFHLSCCLSLYPGDFAFNPLSPNIHIQILQTDPYIFPQRMS